MRLSKTLKLDLRLTITNHNPYLPYGKDYTYMLFFHISFPVLQQFTY